MATFVNDLRLTELATGEGSGTWGDTTNTNLELISSAMGHGAEAIANASTHTITMADGADDEFRSTFLRLTGGGQACTVTLAPNTLSHTWIMRNETNSTLTLTQGTGANVAISAGQTKIVATDGAGSGAVVYELDDLELAGNMLIGGTLGVTGVVTANAGVVVDNITIDGTEIDSSGSLTLDVAGNLTINVDGTTITLADDTINFGQFFNNSSGQFNISAPTQDKDIVFIGNDGGSTITALTLDMSDAGTATFNHDIKLGDDGQILFGSSFNGTIGTASGDLFIGTADANVLFFNSASILPANSVGGTRNDAIDIGSSSAKFKDAHFSQTVDAGALTVDNITIDGNEIDVSSGTLTFDVASDIIFDSDSGGFQFKDGGTEFGRLLNSSTDFVIKSAVSDKDMLFRGNDGGSEITALTLDMSDAGTATFNHDVKIGDDGKVIFGASDDLTISHSTTGNHSIITESGAGNLILAADNLEINNAANNENKIVATSDGAVTLYHDNQAKIATVSGGIQVTGDISNASGDLTLDVAADIILNADGGDWKFSDGSDAILEIQNDGSGNAVIITPTSDKDMKFLGNDGGSTITALTLDMSNAGEATFNDDINLSDGKRLRMGIGGDFEIFHDGSNNMFKGATSDQDMKFNGVDGGVEITALLLDMSDAGAATFNSGGTFGGVLAVNSGTTNTVATFTSTDSGAGINLTDSAGTSTIQTKSANLRIGVDEDGAVASSAIQFRVDGATKATLNDSGVFTCDGGVVVDNITIDGTEIDLSSGDLTLDVAGGIVLDADDSGTISFKDGGTRYALVQKSSDNFEIQSMISDGDLVIKGNDGGSTITALTLDMSDAGAATFNSSVILGSDLFVADTITHRGDTDTKLTFDTNSLNLTAGNHSVFDASSTGIVFNEASADADFRVESNNNTHMVFVDAGNDRLGIGEVSSPSATVHINSGANNEVIRLESTDTEAFIHLKDLTGSSFIKGRADLRFEVGSADVVQMLSSETVINNGSNDYDFRVESNNNDHMLFVEAGTDVVYFGTSAATLFSNNSDVYGASIDADGYLQISRNNGSMLYLNRQNANGEMIDLRINGSQIGSIGSSSESLFIKSVFQDRDIIFKGDDGGTEITALTLDMSDAGSALFNNNVTVNSGGSGNGLLKINGATGNTEALIFQRGGTEASRISHSNSANLVFSMGSSVTDALTINNLGSVGIGVDDGDVTSDGNSSRTYVGIIGSGNRGRLNLGTTASNGADSGYLGFTNGANTLANISVDTASGAQTTGTLFINGTGNIDIQSPVNYGVIFNEDSVDADFRVESNGQTHMLFVDGGNDRIHVKTASNINSATLCVGGTIAFNGQTAGSFVHDSGFIDFDTSSNLFRLHSGGSAGESSAIQIGTLISGTESEAIGVDATGSITINEDGIASRDFTVESDNKTNMFFLDAGNDRIGIQNSSPATTLDIGVGGVIRFRRSDDSRFGELFHDTDGTTLQSASSGDNLKLTTAGGNIALQTPANYGVVVNDDSNDADFRVESDSNTHALFVDAGNSRVGINESSPTSQLHVLGNNDSDGATFKLQEANNNTADTLGTVFFGNNVNDELGRILCFTSGSTTTSTLRFMSTADGATAVNNLDLASSNVTFNENSHDMDFRVESNGNANAIFLDANSEFVSFGKNTTALTTTGISLNLAGTATFAFDLTSENEVFILNNNNSTGTIYKMDFRQNNTSVGRITATSSGLSLTSGSDYRLKENVTELTGATDRLKQLTPKRFNFIDEPDITVDGFLAHEVSSIVPEAIDGEKDAVDADGNPKYQTIDQSKLVPLLVATIKELEARIAALES